MLYALMMRIAMRLCWAEWAFIVVVILIALSSLLSGCGKTGNLYLPDKSEQQLVPGTQPTNRN